MSDFSQKMRDAEDQMYEEILSHNKVKRYEESDDLLRLWVEEYGNASVFRDIETHSKLRFGGMCIDDGLIEINCAKI